MFSCSLVSTVVKPGLLEEGLSSFCEADSSLFRRNLCILQMVDALNPLISRNGLFPAWEGIEKRVAFLQSLGKILQHSCDLCIVSAYISVRKKHYLRHIGYATSSAKTVRSKEAVYARMVSSFRACFGFPGTTQHSFFRLCCAYLESSML